MQFADILHARLLRVFEALLFMKLRIIVRETRGRQCFAAYKSQKILHIYIYTHTFNHPMKVET